MASIPSRHIQAAEPFVHSRASRTVIAAGLSIIAVGIALPFSPVGRYLGFARLPSSYWPILAVTLAGYLLLTHGVKSWPPATAMDLATTARSW